VLEDEASVRRGLLNVVDWIVRNGFQNVVLEIANEFDHRGFDHRMLRPIEGQSELILLVKKTAPDLLVSTSGLGHGRYPHRLAEVADFLLIHFNGTKVEDIPDRIAALKQYGKPIVCNKDDKQGETAARAAQLCVTNGASWGLMLNTLNQYDQLWPSLEGTQAPQNSIWTIPPPHAGVKQPALTAGHRSADGPRCVASACGDAPVMASTAIGASDRAARAMVSAGTVTGPVISSGTLIDLGNES
jgi:hypothetical protein